MSDYLFSSDKSSPKLVMTALVGVVALHAVAVFGLSRMKIVQLELPKFKPMEVQFINLVEDETPPTAPVEPTPLTPTPAPPKPVEPPKPTPPKPIQPPKPVEPPKPAPAPVPTPTSIQTSAPTPALAPPKPTPEPSVPTPTPPPTPVPVPTPEPSVPVVSRSAMPTATAVPSSNVSQATTEDTGPIKLSGSQVQASWVSAPNLHFSAEQAVDFNPRNKSVIVTFNFSKDGSINGVTISTTGDRSLDREIRNRIARAKLHPQIVGGMARSGTASVNLMLSGF